MIKNIERIDFVKEFIFLKGNLFILTQNEILSKKTNKSLKGEFYCIRIWRNFLLTQNKKEDNILILNSNLKNIKEISGYSNYALWLINDCGLIPVEDKVFEINNSLDLKETEIVIFPKDCINKYGVRRAKNSVFCDNLFSFNLNWKFELGDNIKVGGDFILFNKFVIIPTTNQDLICVAIETGKELWRLPNCNLYHQQQPSTGYLVGLSANSFGDNFYQVIDPIKGEKLIDKKFENFFYETSPNLACISETHYYFISNVLGDGTGTKSERASHLGCINLNTHELEWVEKLSQNSNKETKYQKPEHKDGKFYLLDNRNTLHIYEDVSTPTVV